MTDAAIVPSVAEARATNLLPLAVMWLRQQYPTAIIVPEFSIGAWGAALIDLAAICEDEIIGVEIKGDGDSPTRIKLQAAVYSKAADRMFLLPAPSIQARCYKAAPRSWGQLALIDGTIQRAEPHEYSRRKQPERLHIAAGQILQALWRDELDFIARTREVTIGKRLCKEGVRDHLAEHLPLSVIRSEVCSALRRRDWERVGKRVFRPVAPAAAAA